MEKFIGINIEYQKTNRLALATIVAASRVYHRLTRLEVEGQLPDMGSALLVANHTSSMDVLKMAHAIFSTSKRLIRGVAKKPLLEPGYREPVRVATRTDKIGRFDPMALPFVSYPLAFVLNGIGAIPVRRGETDRFFLVTCEEALNSGQMVGIFIQETRVKDGSLQNPMPGVGYLAMKNPDTRIIPIGIWPKQYVPRVVIGDTFTYNQLRAGGTRLGLRETTSAIADRIAQLLPDHIQQMWETEDKPLFLSKK